MISRVRRLTVRPVAGPVMGAGGDAWLPGLLGALAALGDSILGVGAVLPCEVVVTGLASTLTAGQLGPFFALVTVGAVLGDHLNYGLGRVFGQRVATSRVVARVGVRHWDRGVAMVTRYGAGAVVVTRLVPVVRTLVPAIAGAGRMSYRSFLVASVLGSLAWTATWSLAGGVVLAFVRTTSPVWWIAAALGVLAAIGWWRARRSHARPAPAAATHPAEPGPDRGAGHLRDVARGAVR